MCKGYWQQQELAECREQRACAGLGEPCSCFHPCCLLLPLPLLLQQLLPLVLLILLILLLLLLLPLPPPLQCTTHKTAITTTCAHSTPFKMQQTIQSAPQAWN